MRTLRHPLAPLLLSVAAVIASICATAAHRQEAAVPRPASTLVRPSSSTAAPDPEGFLRRWLLLEPIPVSGQLTQAAVREAVTTAYFPDQLTVLPHDGDTVHARDATLTWHAIDTINYNVNLFHFAHALGKPTSNVLFWAVTFINVPRDMPGVRLAIGSNAASVWWVNGTEVIGIYNDRQTVIDDGVSKRLTLKQDANTIRAAIINGGGATDFCARFLDDRDRPVKTISISLSGR
jgi:hypothetical protein